MSVWVPPPFASSVLAPVREGETVRVTVTELVGWFGFTRRGARVNAYIREAFEAHGLVCAPALEAAFPGDTLAIHARNAAPTAPPVKELPHPFAATDALVATQSGANRVRTRLDLLERTLAYLVVAKLATLRSAAGTYADPVHRALAQLVTSDHSPGPPLSFGTWLDVARRLSAIAPSSEPRVAVAATALVADTDLMSDLTKVVQFRNKAHHGVSLPLSAYTEVEPTIERVGIDLRRVLRPLLEGELVCVCGTTVGESAAYRYRLRVLHGLSPYFPQRELETDFRMAAGWAYLLFDGHAPLRLAPGIYCAEDAVTEQVTLYFSRTLALRPKQAVRVVAFGAAEERKELLPS